MMMGDSMGMDIHKAAQRITTTLFVTQSLGSAGFITIATVNSIAGAHLSGQPALAGLPSAVHLLGSAFSAWVWGYLMERLGRRGSLLVGIVCGILGAGVAMLALVRESFAPFLAGLVLMGMANAALQLSRFVSAEVHPPQERGRAISNVVLGGTVGAIFGPLIVGPSGAWMARRGLEELAGPFGAAILLLGLAWLVIFLLLRPEPRELARQLSQQHPVAGGLDERTRPTWEILIAPGPLTAILAMVFSQMVMVMLMVITGLHMKGHQHALTDISLVISSHTFGMYAFSVISGRLSDRFGRGPVILAGAVTLVLSCLLAPLSPERLPLAVALFLLGLGWNFCFVGGSSLLADHLSAAERTRVQGLNDLMIGLASALGSLGSGVVFAALGYSAMSMVGAVTALIPLVAILRWQMQRPRTVTA